MVEDAAAPAQSLERRAGHSSVRASSNDLISRNFLVGVPGYFPLPASLDGKIREDCVMVKGRGGVRPLLVALSLCFSFAWFAPSAQAHHRHHHHRAYAHHRVWRSAFHAHHLRATRVARVTSTNFAAIVVDGNSGRVLYARNENELRHPASITKVMTLYLLFEELEKGRLHLDSRIPISAHAAAQAPTKLGLDPGETISIEDAIKAIVTLSANDIAVAIAEDIGGDEPTFAAMMTREAHALGMFHTHYANASGLPNDAQITTAADLAILGRAIQERFPRYYHYFSTRAFAYDGVVHRNHNHLLGRIDGLDGIKTGYTRDSGFNLLTSVKHDGRFIVSVVLGGTTAAGRDRIMAGLIESEIDKGSRRRTAPMIAEVGRELRHAGELEKPIEHARDAPFVPAAGPLPVASIAPTPIPRPAFVSSTPMPMQPMQIGPMRHVAYDGSTERPTASTTTPSMLRWAVAAPAARDDDGEKFVRTETLMTQGDRSSARDSQRLGMTEDGSGDVRDPLRPATADGGWMIQIGATDDATAATKLLFRAKAHASSALHAAEPFTERVRKGDQTLYRARFAGLDADDAQAACRSLKRSGFACFATKN
jgi:D-alanyl-D-alanine carboxypeptidase